MSEMVERVARAQYALDAAKGFLPPWDHAAAHVKDFYCETARAAIEAMREPTEAMLEVGAQYCYQTYGGDWDTSLNDARVSWQAMIDETLDGVFPRD